MLLFPVACIIGSIYLLLLHLNVSRCFFIDIIVILCLKLARFIDENRHVVTQQI